MMKCSTVYNIVFSVFVLLFFIFIGLRCRSQVDIIRTNSFQEGFDEGKKEGYKIGYNEGYCQGISEGQHSGYSMGYNDAQMNTVECVSCNGRGVKTCFSCNGVGCFLCGNTGVEKCSMCSGRGWNQY